MPSSSRRCGMITRREAERLVNSFLESTKPLNLPENFVFEVYHHCAWGCRGLFIPIRYNSSRAKCIRFDKQLSLRIISANHRVFSRCSFCDSFLSPNKFIFHSHRLPNVSYVQPDSPNFNAWRRHLRLHNPTHSEDLRDAWEDVKAMFNGGNRKRSTSGTAASSANTSKSSAANHNNKSINEDDEEKQIDIEEEDEIEEKKEEEEEIEIDGKSTMPTPPPAKIGKTRIKKLPIHNVVSSTTTDEQLLDMNMFLPPSLLPPLPPPSSCHYFPFPPPLPSSNSLSFVTLNSTDWLQFFRSPLFVPNSFRLPLTTTPRRFPFELNTPNPSIIGSGSHSAFKPPIQKHD